MKNSGRNPGPAGRKSFSPRDRGDAVILQEEVFYKLGLKMTIRTCYFVTHSRVLGEENV